MTFPNQDWWDKASPNQQPKPVQQCLHDSCSRCNGKGIDKTSGTLCIHSLSCPCRKCTPWSM